jgi:hypothetical protein
VGAHRYNSSSIERAQDNKQDKFSADFLENIGSAQDTHFATINTLSTRASRPIIATSQLCQLDIVQVSSRSQGGTVSTVLVTPRIWKPGEAASTAHEQLTTTVRLLVLSMANHIHLAYSLTLLQGAEAASPLYSTRFCCCCCCCYIVSLLLVQ